MFAARAATEAAAREGIARMRFAVGVDDDLREFHARFRDDPVIGRGRARASRAAGAPDADAVGDAHVGDHRAADRVRARGGDPAAHDPRARAALGGAARLPPAAVVAAQAPALLESCGLAAKRALAMRRAAGEVAAGGGLARGVAGGAPVADVFARLLAIREIGPWTVEMVALHGLGQLDVVPAGDLGYLQLVGALRRATRGVADEAEVREFFAPYAP